MMFITSQATSQAHTIATHYTYSVLISAVKKKVHRSKHVQTRQRMRYRMVQAPGSNPMLVMALANPSTDLKKPWLSDLGVFSCS